MSVSRSKQLAAAHLEVWCQRETQSDIGRSMKKLANTIKITARQILNYFPNRLTNGLMEEINYLIQAAKSKARGYRNINYFKAIIYLIAVKFNYVLPI